VTGIGGMIGYSFAILADILLGQLLTNSGAVAYVYAFAVGGILYLATLLVAHIIMPNLNPLPEEKII